MTNAKQAIFEAIQGANKTRLSNEQQIQQDALHLLQQNPATRDRLLHKDLVQAFHKRVETGLILGTSCEIIDRSEDIPNAVLQHLQTQSLKHHLAIQDTSFLRQLDWQDHAIDANLNDDCVVSVSLANYGIAETGSAVIHSAHDMPVLLNFLCLHHVIVIRRSTLLPYLDDYGQVAAQLAKGAEIPRNTCIITGASGTTDIEGVLVRGAHGPESVHILLVDLE